MLLFSFTAINHRTAIRTECLAKKPDSFRHVDP